MCVGQCNINFSQFVATNKSYGSDRLERLCVESGTSSPIHASPGFPK